uniref:Uncharacterized protein n=1 Tax=Anopheles melas TaxID=34690 RepID=A0A182UBY5_9DIPT
MEKFVRSSCVCRSSEATVSRSWASSRVCSSHCARCSSRLRCLGRFVVLAQLFALRLDPAGALRCHTQRVLQLRQLTAQGLVRGGEPLNRVPLFAQLLLEGGHVRAQGSALLAQLGIAFVRFVQLLLRGEPLLLCRFQQFAQLDQLASVRFLQLPASFQRLLQLLLRGDQALIQLLNVVLPLDCRLPVLLERLVTGVEIRPQPLDFSARLDQFRLLRFQRAAVSQRPHQIRPDSGQLLGEPFHFLFPLQPALGALATCRLEFRLQAFDLVGQLARTFVRLLYPRLQRTHCAHLFGQRLHHELIRLDQQRQPTEHILRGLSTVGSFARRLHFSRYRSIHRSVWRSCSAIRLSRSFATASSSCSSASRSSSRLHCSCSARTVAFSSSFSLFSRPSSSVWLWKSSRLLCVMRSSSSSSSCSVCISPRHRSSSACSDSAAPALTLSSPRAAASCSVSFATSSRWPVHSASMWYFCSSSRCSSLFRWCSFWPSCSFVSCSSLVASPASTGAPAPSSCSCSARFDAPSRSSSLSSSAHWTFFFFRLAANFFSFSSSSSFFCSTRRLSASAPSSRSWCSSTVRYSSMICPLSVSIVSCLCCSSASSSSVAASATLWRSSACRRSSCCVRASNSRSSWCCRSAPYTFSWWVSCCASSSRCWICCSSADFASTSASMSFFSRRISSFLLFSSTFSSSGSSSPHATSSSCFSSAISSCSSITSEALLSRHLTVSASFVSSVLIVPSLPSSAASVLETCSCCCCCWDRSVIRSLSCSRSPTHRSYSASSCLLMVTMLFALTFAISVSTATSACWYTV